jgi:hypothetical protein
LINRTRKITVCEHRKKFMTIKSSRLVHLVGALLCAIFSVAAWAGAVPRPVYLLTSGGSLIVTSENQFGALDAALPISGLNAGDALRAIDVRPSNGRLYGLAVNSTANTAQLYHLAISATSVLATPIGATGTFVNAGGSNVPIMSSGSAGFGFCFNPAVDRARAVNTANQNFRMNPNTGAFLDGDLGGAAGSVAGLNMDGPITGGAIGTCAYTNRRINTTATTLYTLSAFNDTLYIQNPPNSGTQTLGTVATLGGSPLDFSAPLSMAIPPGVDVATSNTPATAGFAYVAEVRGGVTNFYSLNLATAVATALSSNSPNVVIGIAVGTDPNGITLNSIGPQLRRFAMNDVSTTVNVSLTGLTAGEKIVGIDNRPNTGNVYALGVNAAANNATLYLVDPQTGTLTLVGASAGLISFTDAMGFTVDLIDTSYAIAFNPTVDRIRVVTTNGLNFRVNPITGGPVDGDLGGAAGSVVGVNPDGAINAGAVGLSGAAYTNNVAGTTVTTLYTLDSTTNQMFIQNPPNVGSQTLAQTVTLNGVPFDFNASIGFDIPPGVNVATSNTAATGFGFATLATPTGSALYKLDLATAQITTLGAVPIPVDALIVWQAPIDGLFFDGFE